MVFSDADKAIIKHHHEKGYTAYTKWKDHPEKHCDKILMKWFIKRFEALGAVERQKSSGCSQTATIPENEETIEEIICSQEDRLRTHVPQKSLP